MNDTIPYSQARLADDLRALGVTAGQVVMLHASVKAVGWLLGGANIILQALFETLTPAGTLMMYAGWQDCPDPFADIPPHLHNLYLEHHPPFDLATSRAVRENSILAEFLRTWPRTLRSNHPEASMVANGARAAYLVADHPLQECYGTGSPLEKLIGLNGQILLLGSPLDTITLLHYAEFKAQMRHKNRVRTRFPVLQDGKTVWVESEGLDTSETFDDYEFEDIAADYLASGQGRRGKVGDASAYLLDAADLSGFAVNWLESRFGVE